MLFNSLTFIAFLAIVLAIYSLPISWRVKKIHLLVSSYIFYAAWNPPLVILIWISTVVDWHVAKVIAKARTEHTRRLFLAVSLSTNLGLLAFFKYGEFFLDNFVALAMTFGIHYQPPDMGIILPIGISFYTFQTLSYTIDVYRRRLHPSHSFLDFALFVTFFPQLVAGPIVRASQFLPQLRRPRRASVDEFGWGLCLLTMGLFQKIVLADTFLAPVADAAYSNTSQAGFLDAWVGTLAFSAQIFFDFAGYSTCAIGVAMLMGFALPDNFRFPYAAIGFSDFWRRWHISLSGWLRDYLYISLGGNRVNTKRVYVNLMATMLLGGLWHGAAWTFVAWGGLHGLYLATERRIKARVGNVLGDHNFLTKLFLILGTYVCVCTTWVFFRARTFPEAFAMFRAMIGARPDGNIGIGGMASGVFVIAITFFMLAGQWYLRDRSVESLWNGTRPIWRAVALTLMLVSILLTPGEDRAFIYFQF